MLMSGNLRKDYAILHELENDTELDAKLKEFMMKELKIGIRNYYRVRAQQEEENIYKWKSHNDEWDSRYCRIEYEGVPTEEEIKEYIEDEWWHWYNPYGDGRDCTGVWFTTHIYVFPIPALDKTIVYHFQAMDV